MKNLGLYILLFILASCAVSDEINDPKDIDHTDYDQAFEFLKQSKVDSAFLSFNKAKELFSDLGDSLRAGSCLVQMAIIQTDQADYFGGQETSLEALSYLNADNPDHAVYLSANFNNLGIATYSLKDFHRALAFYDAAISHAVDSQSTLVYLNNKARVYHSMGEFDKAIEIYSRVIAGSEGTPRSYARLLTNMTLSRWRQDPQYHAAPEFITALRIREKAGDLAGRNSSYMHLCDYYENRSADSALLYARKFYATSLAIRNSDDQIRALYRLIRLSPHDSAKHYFETYKALSDSVQIARSTAKNQFALIRYEVEKNKADNLRLQKENAETAYQAARQRIWTGSAFTLAVLIVGGGVFWHKRRTQRLALEAQHRIDAHQLKTSKKIHDVVANGIYRVMAEIENQDTIDREGILDRLENMYETSRDISYETNGTAEAPQDYQERIAQLLKSFATASTKIIIVGNAFDLWEGVGMAVKAEVECILQELMVNMRKHSEATNVVVRFEKAAGQLRVLYNDNGVGLPNTFVKGNGLISTGSRIASLNGQINFVSEGEKGLKITVTLPIA